MRIRNVNRFLLAERTLLMKHIFKTTRYSLVAWVLVMGFEALGQEPSLRWIDFGSRSSPCISTTSRVRAAFLSVSDLSYEVCLPGMATWESIMKDGSIYSMVKVPGASEYKIGGPDIPVFGEWLLVPNGTTVSVYIEPGKPTVFTGISLAPVQPPKPNSKDASDPPFMKDNAIYTGDADYPGMLAEIEPVKRMRGQDCTLLWVYPYQYNPVRRTLKVYQDLYVDISFAGKVQSIPERLRSPAFETMLARLASNAFLVLPAEKAMTEEEASSERNPEAGGPTTRGNGETGGCDNLIICDASFETAANSLAAWKRLSGFRTKVVTTSTTGTSAAQIESYIDASQSWNPAPSYVLLLGDAEYIPCHYEIEHASDPDTRVGTGLIQGYVASDRYYGDTNEDWYADLFLGRLPVDSLSEANTAVNRILDYEQTPPDPGTYSAFYTDAAMSGYFQDGGKDGYADRRFAKTSEDIYQYLTVSEGYNCERIYYTESDVTPTNWTTESWALFENDTSGAPLASELLKPTFPWDGSTSDISAAINAGLFLITHRDHGSRRMYSVPYDGYWYPGGWADPEFLPTDVAALSNGSLSPLVWSINCRTGWFDNETDDSTYARYVGGSIVRYYEARDADECFCEQFVLDSNGGAVGVIGATRNSYSGNNDRLAWGWMDAIWPGFIEYHNGSYGGSDPIIQFGPVLEYGRDYFLTKYWSGSSYTQTTMDEYVLFGDPTTTLWTAAPVALSVIHPCCVQVSRPTDVTVQVERTGVPLQNARVTISRAATPDDYWTGSTDASGKITFTGLTASVVGDYDIVVVGQNALPYEGIIASMSAMTETWVDYAYSGVEMGTYSQPFNTVVEGLNVVSTGGTVKIKAGTSASSKEIFPLRVNQHVILQAPEGPVAVGE